MRALREWRRIIFLLSAFCISCFASTLRAEPLTIRFSHVVEENTPKGRGARMFQELVNTRLQGKVRVVIYPRSEKFTDEQALLGLLFGDIEMAAPSFPKFRPFSKSLQVFDLPFLFENVEEVHRFQYSPAGQKLLDSMVEKGIRGLAYWDNGMRVVSTRVPVRSIDDLEGLRFRIEPSFIFQRQYTELGVVAIPMPYRRLRDALSGGVVDGYENGWSNILASQLSQFCPYFVEVGHSYLGYMVVTSTRFWDSLPADIRQELEEILRQVTAKVNRLALENERTARQAVLANERVSLVSLSDEEKKRWYQRWTLIWGEFEESIGGKLITAARNAKLGSF